MVPQYQSHEWSLFEQESRRCHARGHKIPSRLEHPLTASVLLPLCDLVVDVVHRCGVVPNHVTLFSFVVRMVAIAMVYQNAGATWGATALFFFGYWLDCLDGVLARRHNLVTSLGDTLEHINDVVTTALMCVVLALQYQAVHWAWTAAFLVAFVGACVHMGLVETYNCNFNHQDNEQNVLYALTSVSRFVEPRKHPPPPSFLEDQDQEGQDHRPKHDAPRFQRDMLWLMQRTRYATDVTVILVLTAFLAWNSW